MGIHVAACSSIINKPLHSVLFMYIFMYIFDIKYKPPASSTFSKCSDENQGIFFTWPYTKVNICHIGVAWTWRHDIDWLTSVIWQKDTRIYIFVDTLEFWPGRGGGSGGGGGIDPCPPTTGTLLFEKSGGGGGKCITGLPFWTSFVE